MDLPTKPMRLLSFNVRVWTRDTDKSSPDYWKTRMTAMKKMIEDINPDIICFQEMSYPTQTYVPSNYKRCGLLTASHHIYCRKGIHVGKTGYNVHWNYADIDGVRVICVHGIWTEKMLSVSQNIQDAVKGKTIMAGDFNINISECHGYGFPSSVRETLGLDAEDTFINWKRPETEHKEIDHVFVYGGLVPSGYEIIKDGYGADRISDHYPVLVTYE